MREKEIQRERERYPKRLWRDKKELQRKREMLIKRIHEKFKERDLESIERQRCERMNETDRKRENEIY